eukprot:10881720-Heterocapsa_arctica.AAC.1
MSPAAKRNKQTTSDADTYNNTNITIVGRPGHSDSPQTTTYNKAKNVAPLFHLMALTHTWKSGRGSQHGPDHTYSKHQKWCMKGRHGT